MIVNELNRIYDVFNQLLFDGKLKPISIIIQPKKKVSIRWVDNKNLIIGADFSKLSYDEIPGIILHEMVHIANFQIEISDVTTNQYHNKFFLQCALKVGLVVVKHKIQGWSITSTICPRNVVERKFVRKPTKEAISCREDAFRSVKFDKAIFRTVVNEIKDRIKLEKPTKTFFLKYQCNCPPPHNSIRSGRRPDGLNALNIQCQNCRSQFLCVTELE